MTVSIVTWLWDDGSARARLYAPEHVNALAKMVKRHLHQPHRMICVADSPDGFSNDVEVVIAPEEAVRMGALRTPEAGHFPSCYRRLWMFSDAARCLGDRVLLTDLDLVVTAPLDPLFERTEDFVGWRPRQGWGAGSRFGGLYLLRTGTRTHVWTDFTGQASIDAARNAGFRGSDQAWISYKLGAVEPDYGDNMGVYSIRDMKGRESHLPPDARIVQFNGRGKAWHPEMLQIPWIRREYEGA